MGASFANVHVKPVGRVSTPTQLARAVRGIAGAEHWIPARRNEAERSFLLAEGPGGWWSVYDEQLDFTPSPEMMREHCIRLSQAVNGVAVGASVFDSDVLRLVLAQDGRLLDEYDSMPGYFEEEQGSASAAASGNPEAWADLLRPSAPEDLRAAWNADEVFAEDKLAAVAKLLGIAVERATVGYSYVRAEEAAGLRTRERYTVIRFRQPPLTVPADEGDAAVATAPVLLMAPEMEFRERIRAGSEFSTNWGVMSGGAAGRGLAIVGWGDAITSGLVRLDVVEIMTMDFDPESIARGPLARRFERMGSGDEAADQALFEDFVIGGAPAAATGSAEHYTRQQFTAWAMSAFTMTIRGTALQAGDGELVVSLCPLEAWDEGQTATRGLVRVIP
jgi:hypothetical protein